jgi:1-deoxy-D-xylulose-5-phosphate reductoisomerase
VLNAANEAAVARFLSEKLRFREIVPVCEAVLKHHEFDPNPTLDELLKVDRWARQEVHQWMSRP